MSDTVSALLPVHIGVAPDHLHAMVETLLHQTRAVDEVVVVEDGPLTDEHVAVLDWLGDSHPRVLRVKLSTNGGAGIANQAGLMRASGTWIAKVDADDLSSSRRLENQLAALTRSGADVCGTAMLEFDDGPDQIVAIRTMPAEHAQIARRMRSNNPINHPTAVYRRDLAIAVGGYPDFRFMQDYVLFARLLTGGARMINLNEPLVRFRSGEARRVRRAHPDFTRLELRLQQELFALGLVGRGRMMFNIGWRLLYRRLPTRLMRTVNRRLLAAPFAAEGR